MILPLSERIKLVTREAARLPHYSPRWLSGQGQYNPTEGAGLGGIAVDVAARPAQERRAGDPGLHY